MKVLIDRNGDPLFIGAGTEPIFESMSEIETDMRVVPLYEWLSRGDLASETPPEILVDEFNPVELHSGNLVVSFTVPAIESAVKSLVELFSISDSVHVVDSSGDDKSFGKPKIVYVHIEYVSDIIERREHLEQEMSNLLLDVAALAGADPDEIVFRYNGKTYAGSKIKQLVNALIQDRKDQSESDSSSSST